MKTTRYMTLASLLLGLVAVAPASADDVSKAKLLNTVAKARDNSLSAYQLTLQLPATYAALNKEVRNATAKAFNRVTTLKSEVNFKPLPNDWRKMVKDAKHSIDLLEFADDRADDLEEQAEDDDNGAVEAAAKEIRRYLKNAKSQMRDFLKLID